MTISPFLPEWQSLVQEDKVLAGRHTIWLLRLIIPIRFGEPLSALLVFVFLLAAFRLGWGNNLQQGGPMPLLFFSAVLAYSVWVFSFITRKCAQALQELKPSLILNEDAYQAAAAKIGMFSTTESLICSLMGCLGGFLHLCLINGSITTVFDGLFTNRALTTGFAGTLLVWMVLNTLIYALVSYARLFATLGRSAVTINVLHTKPLVPFSRVATISSLAIIGAIALFPLMYVDRSMTMVGVLPGVVALTIPLLWIFTLPIWPVHRRLSAAKEQVLRDINDKIVHCQNGQAPGAVDGDALLRLNLLLQYRAEIIRAPVWPFDASSLVRLVLYLIIVPLTWAGAALLEIVMESYL